MWCGVAVRERLLADTSGSVISMKDQTSGHSWRGMTDTVRLGGAVRDGVEW